MSGIESGSNWHGNTFVYRCGSNGQCLNDFFLCEHKHTRAENRKRIIARSSNRNIHIINNGDFFACFSCRQPEKLLTKRKTQKTKTNHSSAFFLFHFPGWTRRGGTTSPPQAILIRIGLSIETNYIYIYVTGFCKQMASSFMRHLLHSPSGWFGLKMSLKQRPS